MVSIFNSTDIKTQTPSESHRLPCRGCTAACKNYSTCGGKPWRVKPSKQSI